MFSVKGTPRAKMVLGGTCRLGAVFTQQPTAVVILGVDIVSLSAFQSGVRRCVTHPRYENRLGSVVDTRRRAVETNVVFNTLPPFHLSSFRDQTSK